MKRFFAVAIIAVMLFCSCATAFAIEVENFKFTLTTEAALKGYYISQDYAHKTQDHTRYASIRVNTWSAIPKRTLHTGIVNQNVVPYTYFEWMSPPSSKNESVRVFSKYKDEYVGYTGSGYRHYAAMRLNTEETVSPVVVTGVFTPDSK